MKYDNRTPENKVKDECVEWLFIHGWFNFNIKQGRYCYRGISDRIAMKNGMVLFIEFKTDKGKQSPEQINFENDVKSKGCHYLVAKKSEDIEIYLKKVLDLQTTF